MADLSQVELNGTTYDLKDLTIRRAHGLDPIATKTYTNVIATANDNNGAGFFYLKVRADTYTTAWHVKTRVKATIPGNVNYSTDTTFDIWGHSNTYSWYACLNRIRSTSYRAIYNNSLFRLNETGYNNGCANWVGFNLISAHNNTSSSYKRQVVVELLEYDGCTVELQDSLITPTNIPNRAAHTDWYTSTNTSFDNFDACSYGLKQSGDANTTDISNLTFNNGTYIADSAVYRYQLLFQKDENTLTPLNNNDNTTGTSKTMLTAVEFNPFGRIVYYNSTTNISAGGSLGAGALFWQRSGFDLRYTFNCGTTLTAQKPFYLVVTPTSNGLCKIASTTPWSQTLPISNDGKWYILLGRTYSTYQMALYAYHPVYYYDGTKVRMLVDPDINTAAANVYAYGVCNTPAATAAKEVTIPNFVLVTGATIRVKFTYSNEAGGTTLNVSGTGAKQLYRYGQIKPAGAAEYSWNAGAIVSLTYDGESWYMNDWLNNNTKYGIANDMQDGLVPQTNNGVYSDVHFLMDDTTQRKCVWGVPPNATQSKAGYMSASDKTKLDTISGVVVSDTAPTTDVLVWIDPDSSDTIGILSETEINSQYVSHDHAQTLTSAQQNRALQNIGISDGTDTQKTNLATFAGISLTVVGTI